MARSFLSSEVDEIELFVHKRNALCSELLLRSLRANHGHAEPPPDLEQEPEAIEPEPLTAEVIQALPIVQVPFPIIVNKIEQIKRLVCKRYNISKEGIESASRKKVVALPRQIAMYLSRKYTTHSFPEIGRRFGGRDHTTILHAHKKIGRLAASDVKLAGQLAELRAEIPA